MYLILSRSDQRGLNSLNCSSRDSIISFRASFRESLKKSYIKTTIAQLSNCFPLYQDNILTTSFLLSFIEEISNSASVGVYQIGDNMVGSKTDSWRNTYMNFHVPAAVQFAHFSQDPRLGSSSSIHVPVAERWKSILKKIQSIYLPTPNIYMIR